MTETSEKEDSGFLSNVEMIFKCSIQVPNPIEEELRFMQTETLTQLRERILIQTPWNTKVRGLKLKTKGVKTL